MDETRQTGLGPEDEAALGALGRAIRRDAWHLAARWLDAAIEAVPAPEQLSPWKRFSSMPTVLVAVGDALSQRVPPDVIREALTDIATSHGATRREQRFGESDLVREVRLLRELVMETASANIRGDAERTAELHRRLDAVVDEFILHATCGFTEGEVEEMRRLSLSDPLTGLLNRRGLEDRLGDELERARRYRRPLGLVYVDVDQLNALNDRAGHSAGDRLLLEVAATLAGTCRGGDLCSRIGGDEFCVALIEQDREGAAAFGARVGRICGLEGNSISYGEAALPEDGPCLQDLLDAANRRLYASRGIRLDAP